MRPHIFIVLLILLVPLSTLAEQRQGRVIGVHDGDTFTLLEDGDRQSKIRMAEMDAPELKQPYGNKAKRELSSLIFGKRVAVEIEGQDRYSRLVGRVFVDRIDVNAQMIVRGAAWVYLQYLKDKSLLPLQAEAQQAKRGLWKLPESEHVPPWEWRHPTTGNASHGTTQNTQVSLSRGNFTCGTKQTCRQMMSCAEARFYLNTCGLSSLDGNHDGVPCARLCR